MPDKFSVHFDFDCEGETPAVLITRDGHTVLEVHDAPTCDGEWSWDESKWTAGIFTAQLVKLMNEYA